MFATPEILSIVFIQEDEIVNPNPVSDETIMYREDNFINNFMASDTYMEIYESKSLPVWTYMQNNANSVFYYRGMKSLYGSKNIAILALSIDPTYFLGNLNSEILGQGAEISVVDSQGKIVASTDLEATMGGN